SADGVVTEVLRTGVAAAVTVETGQRVGAASFEFVAEYVAGLVGVRSLFGSHAAIIPLPHRVGSRAATLAVMTQRVDDSTDGPDEAPGAHYVQSLDRGLAVIRAFGEGNAVLTLSEVARATE